MHNDKRDKNKNAAPADTAAATTDKGKLQQMEQAENIKPPQGQGGGDQRQRLEHERQQNLDRERQNSRRDDEYDPGKTTARRGELHPTDPASHTAQPSDSKEDPAPPRPTAKEDQERADGGQILTPAVSTDTTTQADQRDYTSRVGKPDQLAEPARDTVNASDAPDK